ncbi:carcinoembryonic antigen-related cell adhesion molecule 5-like [Spea bombifrons]|uniref:carcinoembryonic antigen-related cell adhesion molecule 5-like n=1 Tax=Spea bombifrons TaxID=233779 RepID=UPI002348F01C|nr:carcinoembryonic antigen-related cell adhesion molecule 5-like [Spea bombifrons]
MALKLQLRSGIFVLPVLLGLWMEPVGGIDIQLVPQYPAVGQSVTLSVTGITGTILTFNWFKGQSLDADDQILGYFPSSDTPQTTGKQYFSRARGLPNGSLLITDLLVTDRGYYTVSVQTAQLQQASVNLTVYEKVSKPVITASTSQPKENYPVTLTCDTVNAESIQWGRRGAGLPSDVQQSSDNRSITFPKINRTDTGGYYCEAGNPISKDSSDTYTVTVNYGPESLSITGPTDITEGGSLRLECSADSVPQPLYSWIHNGTIIQNQISNKLSINKVTLENQGNYTCVANNSVTLQTAATNVLVTVSEKTSSDTQSGVLSPGAIAGIVIAILLVAALSFALIYLFVIRKSRKTPASNNDLKPSSSTSPGNGLHNAGQSGGGEPELQYSSIQFAKKPPPSRTQPNEENIVYSELRLP